MRVVVMGAGGLGGYYGGLLARAGHEVVFVARGAHLAALRATGLTVRSEHAGSFHVAAAATDDPADLGPTDLVLFCVKNYDAEPAAAMIRPLVGPDTVVLPVLNGVDVAQRIGRVVGPGRVVAAASYVASRLEGPGLVVQGGMSGALLIGEPGAGASPRCQRLRDLLVEAGAPAEVHPVIDVALWEKMVVVCAGGGVMALMRLPIGPILACAESRDFFRATMDEVEAVARASGVPLPAGSAERALAMVARQKPWYRSSMLTDVLAGRRLELEWLNGAVVRLGRDRRVPTPSNAAIYAALKPHADGAPEPPTPA